MFYQGRPCKKCGQSIRYTKGGNCYGCRSEYAAEWHVSTYEHRSESMKEYKKEYRKHNKHIRQAHDAKRRSMKKAALHPHRNIDTINEIYSSCPTGYHVDHIIPISKGGLHHEANLRIISAKENLSKSNKLDVYLAESLYQMSLEKIVNTYYTHNPAAKKLLISQIKTPTKKTIVFSLRNTPFPLICL